MKKWFVKTGGVLTCCYTHKKKINTTLYLWHFFKKVRKLKFTFIDLEKQKTIYDSKPAFTTVSNAKELVKGMEKKNNSVG